MRIGALASLLALGGCQLVFGLDGASAPDTQRCGPFGGARTELGISLGGARFDPQTAPEPDELWVSSSFGGSRDVWRVRREATDAFTNVEQMNFNDGDDGDWDPSLTADGLLLFFLSDRGGADEVYQVEQAAGDFVESAKLVGGLPEGIAGFDLSADGLAFYGSRGDRQLFVARRGSREEPFPMPEPLGFGGEYPSISADELELYYNDISAGTIVRRTRPSPDLPFGPEEAVFDNGVALEGIDPDLSHDGTRLVFASSGGGSVFELTRTCE